MNRNVIFSLSLFLPLFRSLFLASFSALDYYHFVLLSENHKKSALTSVVGLLRTLCDSVNFESYLNL